MRAYFDVCSGLFSVEFLLTLRYVIISSLCFTNYRTLYKGGFLINVFIRAYFDVGTKILRCHFGP